MKSLWTLSAVAALVSIGSLIAWVYSPHPTTTPAPVTRGVVHIPEPVVEFGRVGLNDTIRGSFAIVNDSGGAITLDQIAKSCSCTAAEFSPRSLPPGERAEVRFVIHTGAHRGPRSETVGVTFTDGKGTAHGPIFARVMFTPTGVFGIDPPEVLGGVRRML